MDEILDPAARCVRVHIQRGLSATCHRPLRFPRIELTHGFRKLNFTRGGTFQPNSQRKTFTVDQYHPLRTLAPLGFAEGSAPLFRRGEAAVQKGLIPLEQAVLIQRLQQRAPRIQPDALIFPLGPVLIPATSRKLPQF